MFRTLIKIKTETEYVVPMTPDYVYQTLMYLVTQCVSAWFRNRQQRDYLIIFYSSRATFLKPWSQLRFDYDTTMIRRCHDAFDYDGSDRNYDSTAIRPRQDYDEKIDVLIFFARRTRRCQSHGSRRGTTLPQQRSWASWRNSLRHNKRGFYER